MQRYLIRHPQRGTAYFDRQNYRYQTMRVPGGARPRETYHVVTGFSAGFPRHPARVRAVRALLAAHPDLQPVFARPGARRRAARRPRGGDGAAARPAVEAADGLAAAVTADGQAAYDAVADLYACTFADVRVRRAEWRWLESKLPRGGEVAAFSTSAAARAPC